MRIKNIFQPLIGNTVIFIAITFAAIVLLLTWNRLSYGVDFTDEAYYAAVPWHFLHGGRLFIDEALVFVQFPSLFAEIFLRLYLAVTGSLTGLILFLRQVYFLVQCLVGLTVFFAIKKTVPWQIALILALIPIAFVPWNIPALSYNSLGADLFLVGCLFVWRFSESQAKAKWMAVAGVVHGLAALAYPTLPIPIAIVGAVLFIVFPQNRRRALFYALGVIAVGLAVLPFILNIGLGNVWDSVVYTRTIGRVGEAKLGGLEKLAAVFLGGWNGFTNNYAALAVFGFLFFGLAKNPKLFHVFTLYIPLLVFALFLPGSGYVNMGYFSYCVFAFLPIFWIARRRDDLRQLFFLVGVPSLAAGAVMAWSSDNGFVVSSLGFLAVGIAGFIASDSAIVAYGGNIFQRMIPATIFVAILMVLQYSFIFKDGPMSELTSRVGFGPYKSLLTGESKKIYLEKFTNDVNAIAGAGDKILVYSHFPAGYLLANAKPATNSSWLFAPFFYPAADNAATVKYFNEYGIKPDFVVIMKKIPVSQDFSIVPGYSSDDPVIGYVNANRYRLILSGDNYDIYGKQ